MVALKVCFFVFFLWPEICVNLQFFTNRSHNKCIRMLNYLAL